MILSIVIVNWNTRDLLTQCLESVASDPDLSIERGENLSATSLTPPAGHGLWPTEAWVVDNASSDGSSQMVRERFPWVRLIENRKNLGFAAANNQAMRQAQGRYVLLLNSDTEVRPGALPALLQFMEDHPSAGAGGARLLSCDGSLQLSCHPMLTPGREFWRLLFLDRIWPRASYPMHHWDPDLPRRVEVIKGACLLLRREALDQVGLLDERYFIYTEELDLCYRLAQAGWELWWVPQAEVLHHEAQSTRQVAEEMYVQLYRSKVQFYRKSGGPNQVQRFKRWLRLAYWPRLAASTLGSSFYPSLAVRARIYRRLLAELPRM